MPADGRISRRPFGLGGGEQAVEQRGVGEGADRGHEEVGAALQHALAVGAHRLVAGAFGDRVEAMGEEASGSWVSRPPARRARPLHQRRDQLDVLQGRGAASTCLPMAP